MIRQATLRALAILALASAVPALAQNALEEGAPAQGAAAAAPGPLTVLADKPGPVINRDIFGQFAEHLGTGTYSFDKIALPRVDAIAARGKDGKVWLALTNLDPNSPAEITASVPGLAAHSAVGEVLTADRVDSINTFTAAKSVEPMPFSTRAAGGSLVLRLPPHSLTVVRLEQ